MANNLPISVIMPIYKAERTIKKAVNSVLTQTFHNFELLLVDDGSPDSCGQIVDDYADKDNRVIALHKLNGGLSDARNFGLAHASGEYSIFVDPDDWIDNTELEEMYAMAKTEDADIVMCDLYYNDKYRQTYRAQKPVSCNHYDILKDILVGTVHGSTDNKLIRNSLYQKYGISYPQGIYGVEDQYTMCALLKNDMKIAYMPKAFYHYMFYSDTLSRHYDEKSFDMDKKILHMFSDLLSDTPFYEMAEEKFSADIAKNAFWGGLKIYTSKQYKIIFRKYRSAVAVTSVGFYKFLYMMSIDGYYHIMRRFLQMLIDFKQILKRMKLFKG